jgi:hypothetical protein
VSCWASSYVSRTTAREVGQEFGKVVLDELRRGFGWIAFDDSMEHPIEHEPLRAAFGKRMQKRIDHPVQFTSCVQS